MTQSERRRNPYPWTWEIPGAITADLLVLPCLAAQTGRSIANLSAGGGWDFPHGGQLFLSLPGLVAGDATAGLASPTGHSAPAPLLWTCLIVTELVLGVLVVVAFRVAWPRLRAGRLHGAATAAEADQLLGVERLQRHAPIIRPDLYRDTERR